MIRPPKISNAPTRQTETAAPSAPLPCPWGLDPLRVQARIA